MKRISLLSIIVGIGLLISSCSTSTTQFEVLRPADISLPKNISKILIINRYRPAKENRFGNIFEGVFSGEQVGLDRQGAESALNGLSEFMSRSPRYTIFRCPEELAGTGTAWFPPALPAETVANLCKKYGCDALVALEAFDSDKKISNRTEEKTRSVNGKTEKYWSFISTQNMNVTIGWRVYSADGTSMLDEHRMTHNQNWSREGTSESNAQSKLPDNYSAVREIGMGAGKVYARRITPQFEIVSRAYYIKGDKAMKDAQRSVKTKDWNRSREIWKGLLQHPDKKVKGRAAFNLAISYEQEDKIEEAIQWAKTAYTEHGFKKAEKYMQQLEFRKEELKRLEQQMKKE